MDVSVVVTSYNHEKYIAQCLESILSQIGDLQVEIIVGDDCSEDSTRAIAQQFKEKYPEVISLLPLGQNLGITKNLKRCLDICSGDYIAICEGDDYWTDPYKLQKQRDFLEEHKDCPMCFSAVMLYLEDTNTFIPHNDQAQLKKDFITTEDLIERNYIGNFSCCMYRKDIVERLPQGIFDLFIADWMFNIACSQMGKIGFIHEIMSVYRLHSKGVWTGLPELEKMKEISRLIEIYNAFYDYTYDRSFSNYKAIIDYEIIRIRKSQELKSNSQLVPMKNALRSLGKPMLRSLAQRIRQLKRLLHS